MRDDADHSLGLVPFQINPHYVDTPAMPTNSSETREQRLLEYLEENTRPILALREGAWLWVSEERVTVDGATAGARLFRTGHDPVDFPGGSDLSFLLPSATAGPDRDRP